MTAAYKEVRALDVLAAENRGIGSTPEIAAALGLGRLHERGDHPRVRVIQG